MHKAVCVHPPVSVHKPVSVFCLALLVAISFDSLVSPEASVSPSLIALWHTVSGYYGPDGGTCEDCASGKYKNVPGDYSCTTCPDASLSPSASVNISQCLCRAGYVVNISGVVTQTAAEAAAYNSMFIDPLNFSGLGVTQRKRRMCEAIENEKTVENVQQCRKTADIRFDALLTYQDERPKYTWGGTKNIDSEASGCIVMQIRDYDTCGIDTIQTEAECRQFSEGMGYEYQEKVAVNYFPAGCLLTPSKNAFFNMLTTSIQCRSPDKLCLCSRPHVYFNDVFSSEECTDARNCLCRDTRPLKCYPCAQGKNLQKPAQVHEL